MEEKKADKTRNERQARRRNREKQWLLEHGWKSWEAVHTALMKGRCKIIHSSEDSHDQELQSN